MKTFSLTILLALALLSPAHGEAYKCRQPDGRTEISSAPCGAGSKTLKTVEADRVPEEDRLRAEREVARQREQLEKSEQNRQATEKQEREERARAERERLAAEARARPADPVHVPVPYYAPGYVRPPRYPHQPMPGPQPPTPRPGKPVDLYKVPGNTRSR